MVKSDRTVSGEQSRATVVFMRSSFLGNAISASVFDATGADARFVGTVRNGTKVVYSVPPGEHLFMVVSEAADFMKATLDAGKIYYALVTPRMGVWRARFSFRPLRQSDLAGPEFAKWDQETELMQVGPEAEAWARDNAPSV